MALSDEIHNESMVASPRFHPEHDTGKTTTMRSTIEPPTSAPAGPPAYQMSPLEFLARSAVAAMNLIPAYAPRLDDDDDDDGENDDAIVSRYVARKRSGSSNSAHDAPIFEVNESQANYQPMIYREDPVVTQDVAQDAEELVVTQDVAQDEYNEQNAEKLSSLPELIAKECILAVSEKDNIAITPCIAEGDDPGPGAFSRNFPEQSDDADPPSTSTLQAIYETQPATETKTPEAAACTNVEAMTPSNETNADQSKAMQTDFSSPLENMHLDDGATAIDTMDVDEDQFAAKSEVASIDADADMAQHEVPPEAMMMAVTAHIDETRDGEKESFTGNGTVFPNVGAVESSNKTGVEVWENTPLVLNKEVGAMESSKATCDGEEIATENSQKSGITEQNVQNVKNQSVSEQSFAEPSTCADDNNEAFVPEAGDMGTASQLTEVITPQKEIPVSTESDVTNKPQISSMNLTQEKHLNETVPMEIDDAASNNVDATTTSPFSTPGPERVTHSDSDSHGSADAELPGPANAQSPIDDFYEHTLHHVDNLIFPPIIPESSANVVDSWPAKTFRILNLDRLKLKLYMEGRRTHQCQEYERRFSKYWAALSIRLEEELSPSNVHKCEAILQNFLTTKKLRRLHNKLILGLMERCLRPYTLVDFVDEGFPAAWKDRVQITTLERLHEGSGQPVTPTPSVVAAQVKEPCEKPAPAAVDFAYHLIEHDTPLIMEFEAAKASTVLPVSASSRLPGALVVDPYVRSLCTSKNMKVSENAVWLLVIAIKHFAADCLTQALEASRTVEDLQLSLPDEHTSLNLGDTRKFSTEHARCPHKQQRSEQKCRLGAADFHSLLFGMPFKQSVVNSHSRVAFEGSLHSSLDQYAGQDISGMDIVKRFLTDKLSVFTPAQEKHQPSTPAIVSSVACPALSEERTSTPVASGGLGRGAKDLASLKAKTSKPEAPGKITSPFATATEDAAIARPLSSETAPIAAIADANDTPFTSSPGDKSDGGKQSGRRGKGFGVKNLAAMRARSVTSTTDENTIKAAAVVTAAAAAEDDDDNEEFKGDIQDESTIKAAAVVAAVAAEEDDNEEEKEEVKDDIQASAGVDVDGDAELIAEVNLSPAATEQLPAAPNETQRNVE
ncbi:hypothetical protein MPSEU_000314000 [Mayamaea pseudoterrestris]|nr:hypothetical protein MPSEU_000314000 [Mayamaea pseudoterrestris]